MKPLIYAHRGASGHYPENTMTAFRAAHRLGTDGIELDVQLTRDGEVVVIHDPRLERTTNGSGWVRHHTWAELRQLSAGGWLHPHFRKARIPRLQTVLQFLQPTSLRLIVELKNWLLPQPELEERVSELIRSHQLEHRTVISSFQYKSLPRVKELAPLVQTALLMLGPMEHPCDTAIEYGADQLHVPVDQATPELVIHAQKKNLSVIVWTANSRKQLIRAASMGVNGIITDFPLRAKKALRA